MYSGFEPENLDDWKMIEAGKVFVEEDGAEGAAKAKKSTFSNFLSNTKCKLYNMYRGQKETKDTGFSGTTTPVWLLGKEYDPNSALPDFSSDFQSRLWFTYRNDFVTLENSSITTDMGWGCMIRVGQMMLAQGFVSHLLGRDWRIMDSSPLGPDSATKKLNKFVYKQILRWFADSPTPSAPYSIHNICQLATKAGYKVGDYLGPAQIARTLKILLRRHSPDALTLYVPKDAVIYKDRVAALCTNTFHTVGSPVPSSPLLDALELDLPSNSFWRPLLIFIPLRLGLEKINKIYLSGLKRYLQFPQTIGFVGGRPNTAFYFIGFQDDKVIYLDPHLVQPTVRMDRDFSNETYHCAAPKRMAFEDIDPSLALGFYCRDRDDFFDLCKRVERVIRRILPLIVD